MLISAFPSFSTSSPQRAARSRRGARRSSTNGASNTAPSPTAWRKLATRCSHSRGSRRANGSRSEPRTRSSDCTTQTVLPCADRRPTVLGAARLRTDQCARSTDGRPSRRNQTIRPLTSPHDRIASCRPKTPHPIPTQVATGPDPTPRSRIHIEMAFLLSSHVKNCGRRPY